MFCHKSWYLRKIWFGQVAPLIQDQSLEDAPARNSKQWTFLKEFPTKSPHVDVMKQNLWADLDLFFWFADMIMDWFLLKLWQFLRWWSHRKSTWAAVSQSCRPNRSTVQRVQRQIRWKRLCWRRSGAQRKNSVRSCEFLLSTSEEMFEDVKSKNKISELCWIKKTHDINSLILINSPCAYQSAAWKESKPLELPKCINGTLQLESGTFEAPEKRGKCWLGGWGGAWKVRGRDVLQGLVDGWHQIKYSWAFWGFLNVLCCWPDRCFLLGMVMFFNIANLDTKSVVAILGQVCSIVFDLFRFGSIPCDFQLQCLWPGWHV